MENEYVTISVPRIDFTYLTNVDWYWYLVGYLFLAWFVIGPYFSRYYYRYNGGPKEYTYQKHSSMYGGIWNTSFFIWLFAPVTCLALMIAWLCYYSVIPITPFITWLIFGTKKA